MQIATKIKIKNFILSDLLFLPLTETYDIIPNITFYTL